MVISKNDASIYLVFPKGALCFCAVYDKQKEPCADILRRHCAGHTYMGTRASGEEGADRRQLFGGGVQHENYVLGGVRAARCVAESALRDRGRLLQGGGADGTVRRARERFSGGRV